MVFIKTILYKTSQAQLVQRYRKRRFIDSLRIFVKGGAGGMGYPKFGGIGGKGGDVYIVGSESASLKLIHETTPEKRFSAGNGGNSRMYRVLGEPGQDFQLSCPLGVTIVNDSGHKLGEINQEGDSVLVATGGVGGSPKNQFNGQKGDAHSVTLDLKLIADVGLVGYPNAGKSSLLSVLSRANPKIASYPFTTLLPDIGLIEYDDFRQIRLADLPGLIEGAHANIGLGHHFLKHVERTKLMLFVIDIGGFRLSPAHNHRTAFDSLALLTKELELYRYDLLDKPSILVVNKMDLSEADKLVEEFKNNLEKPNDAVKDWPDELRPKKFVLFDEVIYASVKTGQHIDLLKEKIRSTIDLYADIERGLDNYIKDVAVLVEKETTVKIV